MLIWEKVFRTGTHTDSKGVRQTWTIADIDEMVAKYNEQPKEDKHVAPIVVGHPDSDSPAYGWVEELKREGEYLVAGIRDVTKEFTEWVRKGFYRKKSVALYADRLLRHIGYLGAQPPAIKGLPDAAFAADERYITLSEAGASLMLHEYSALYQVDLEQALRAHKFSLPIVAEMGRRTKPPMYSELKDEDFADPVHYRFPLSSPYLRASLAVWNRENVRAQYSEQAQGIVAARLIAAALRNQVSLTPYKWAYMEGRVRAVKATADKRIVELTFADGAMISVPIGSLTKNQLVNTLSSITSNTNSPNKPDLPNQLEEGIMPKVMTEENFNAFAAELITKLTELFSEDIPTQTSAIIEEIKGKYLVEQEQPTETPAPPEAPAPMSEIEKAYAEKLEQMNSKIIRLETERRMAENYAYCESLKAAGQLLPKQIDLAIAALDMGHKHESFKFSEGGKPKEVEGTTLIKNLIESFPKQVEFGEAVAKRKPVERHSADIEVSGKYKVEFAEDTTEIHQKVVDKISEANKAGKELSYPEAFKLVQVEL